MLREVSRHASVEKIDICEIDKMVVDVSYSNVFFLSFPLSFPPNKTFYFVLGFTCLIMHSHNTEADVGRALLLNYYLFT